MDAPKIDGLDLFFYLFSYQNSNRRKDFENPIISDIRIIPYLGNKMNNYGVKISSDLFIKDLNLNTIPNTNKWKSLKILCCVNGINYFYHNTIGFKQTPFISRIVKRIYIDEYCKFYF